MEISYALFLKIIREIHRAFLAGVPAVSRTAGCQTIFESAAKTQSLKFTHKEIYDKSTWNKNVYENIL